MMASMNRPADIELTVFASRGLAVVRSYGLGWAWRSEKETPAMAAGAENWPVTQWGGQCRDREATPFGNLDDTVQDLENKDLIDNRPNAGARCLSADATLVAAGEAA